MAIISASTVKTQLGISGTSEDSRLTNWADWADAAIKRYLNMDVEGTTYPGAATNGLGDSGYYSGDGTKILRVRHLPLRSVASIYVDNGGYWGQATDPFAAATLLTAGSDYAIRWDGYHNSALASFCGIIERIGAVWPKLNIAVSGRITAAERQHQGNIKIAYTAGFTTVPGDIIQAAFITVAYWRANAATGSQITSESQGAYSYSVAQASADLPPEAKRLLNKFKRRFAA